MKLNTIITGTRIKEIREEQGMSQEKLGSLLGRNKSAICRWEKGIGTELTIGKIKAICGIFGVNELWLMGYDDVPKYKVCSENKEMIAEIENLLPSMTSANLKIVLTLVKELSK